MKSRLTPEELVKVVHSARRVEGKPAYRKSDACILDLWDLVGLLVTQNASLHQVKQVDDERDWVEGKGKSVKPADYDQNPHKYEVQFCSNLTKGIWESVGSVGDRGLRPGWFDSFMYRVRLRPKQPKTNTKPNKSQ